MTQFRGYVVVFALGLLLGAGSLAFWQRATTAPEPPAAEIRQDDGSLVLERKPDAKPAKTHLIPAGGKAERAISITVRPDKIDCPICQVDLTVVRMPDDTRRVVASSKTGTVIGGLDIPLVPLHVHRPRPWAAGASYGTGASYGIFLDRDLGALRLGVELNQADERGGRLDARVKIGFRF